MRFQRAVPCTEIEKLCTPWPPAAAQLAGQGPPAGWERRVFCSLLGNLPLVSSSRSCFG